MHLVEFVVVVVTTAPAQVESSRDGISSRLCVDGSGSRRLVEGVLTTHDWTCTTAQLVSELSCFLACGIVTSANPWLLAFHCGGVSADERTTCSGWQSCAEGCIVVERVYNNVCSPFPTLGHVARKKKLRKTVQSHLRSQ